MAPGGQGVVRHVVVPEAPEPPNATWSNCLVVGNEVVMSGVTANPAVDDSGNILATHAQATRIMEKIQAMLSAAGGNLNNIYKLVVYVTDINDKGVVSEVRKHWFNAPFPCSTLVEVKGFAFPGLTIEIDAFARLDIDLRLAQQY